MSAAGKRPAQLQAGIIQDHIFPNVPGHVGCSAGDQYSCFQLDPPPSLLLPNPGCQSATVTAVNLCYECKICKEFLFQGFRVKTKPVGERSSAVARQRPEDSQAVNLI